MGNLWNYGDAYIRHPINDGETAIFDNGSMLMVNDIFNKLPAKMENAEILFVDPPWSTGNLNSFYTKANKKNSNNFKEFYKRLFECIKKISPKICYLEIGKDNLVNFLIETKKIYKYVVFYNSTYYHKKDSLCYIIRGSNDYKKPKLDNIDEEDIIKWVCENEEYNCIGDLCIGRGLVAIHAYKNNKRFVGTELNKKRLSVAIENLVKIGAKYEIIRKVNKNG